MSLVLVITGIALLAMPGLLHRHSRRLSPESWAPIAAGFLGFGIVAVEVGLTLTAAPTVLRAVGLGQWAAMCEQTFGRLAMGGNTLGWVAGATTLLVPLAMVGGWLRARRTQREVVVEPWVGIHVDRGDHEVVIVPTTERLAAATPGPPPQVLLSAGLLQELSEDDFRVVLLHEEAHLRAHHSRYLRGVCAVEALWPLRPIVRGSTRSLRASLERWADEDAARFAVDGREAVRAALLRFVAAPVGPALAGFGTEAVVERIQALATPSRHTRLAWIPIVVPALAATAVASLALARWWQDLQMVLGASGICLS